MNSKEPSDADAKLQVRVLKLRREQIQNEMKEAKQRHEAVKGSKNEGQPPRAGASTDEASS